MNKTYYAYTRVSDARQGEGVSLQQQIAAIQRYADKDGLRIVEHFQEKKTAAKRGRPVFAKMLKLLKARRASGVLMHKIDRSARNLKDWAELGELIDSGTEVHFVNESLDLTSRGGRLSADIQAVVAADYIRNLREEAKKGIYGRLKQGFYPMPAPLGYLDAGAGKPKIPDPARAPLIRRAFELYATGNYSQVALLEELHRLGLRKKNGKRLDQNSLSRMLRVPFYMGLIRIKKTGETYLGKHQPLISKNLFEKVQRVLSGNLPTSGRAQHAFAFRRLFWCKLCGRLLIPESQKGYVYYRCQNRACPTKTVREERIEAQIIAKLQAIDLSSDEHEYLRKKFDEFRQNWTADFKKQAEAEELQLSQIKERLNRLTDAFLDGVLDHNSFEQRKSALLMELRGVEDDIQYLKSGCPDLSHKIDRLLELLKTPYLQYISGSADEKRDLVKSILSNRTLSGKNLEISYALPFSEVAYCLENTCGGAHRDKTRTLDRLMLLLIKFAKAQLKEQGVKS